MKKIQTQNKELPVKKRGGVVVLLLFFFLSVNISGQKVHTTESIRDSLNRQLSLFPHEKLHLHIDRTMYVPGERIWFKAYLVNALSHHPLTNSRYMYVELINSSDSLVHRVMIRKGEDDTYHGYLFLSEMIPAGTYTIRAYTRYMENLGEGYFFTKNIQIGNLLAEDRHVGHGRENRENRGNRGSRDDFDVAILPEGGNLLDGKLCKVAFKAQNRDGTADFITGELIDETGRVICPVQTVYAGMGSFAFMPERGKKYVLKCTNRNGTAKTVELPASQNTFSVFTAWRRSENQHLVTVEKPDASPAKPLYLLAHTSGAVLYFAAWYYRSNFVSFSGKELPSGIIHFVLFDESLNPLSERLVFNKNMPNDKTEVIFSTDKLVYEKREKVIATIAIPYPTPSPVGRAGEGYINLSVSITDDKDIAPDSLTTILSTLLLSSELKGHIETPAYYLHDNSHSEMALDLLMMTHGWRKYKIPDVVRGVYETPKVGFEISRQITGTVKSLYLGRPLIDSEVTIVSSGGEFDIAATGSQGRFGVYGIEYPDSAGFMVKATSRRGSEQVELFMDEERFPKPVSAPVSPVLAIAEHTATVETDNFPSLQRTDDFLFKAAQRAYYDEDIRVINLSEVVVTARRIEQRDVARLKDWRNRSSDLTIYRERILETGLPTIFDILLTIAGVEIFRDQFSGKKIIFLRGEKPLILLDGFPVDSDDLETLEIRNEVASIDVFKTLTAASVFGLRGGSGAISITTRTRREGDDDFDLSRPNYATINPLGYQTPVEFYSPKYDTSESKHLGNPDYRTTIFWKPDIAVSEEGKSSFEFYTSDFPTTYSVVIEGLSADGKIIRHVDRIKVE